MLQRLKQTKIPFGEGQFYIIRNINSVYQLREVESHLVISTANSLDGILGLLTNILNRYKSYTTFKRAISSMSEKENNTKALDRKQKEYRKIGTMYKEEVDLTIRNFLDKQGSKKKVMDIPVKVEDNRKSVQSNGVAPKIDRIKRKPKRI